MSKNPVRGECVTENQSRIFTEFKCHTGIPRREISGIYGKRQWIPAFAGMTPAKLSVIFGGLFAVLAMLLLTVPALAQSPITAKVNRTDITTDETVNLVVTVSSQSLAAPRPELPPLDGFEIVGTGSTSQISMVGTKITSEARYRFQLRPTKTGKLTIPPITLTVNGQTYSTDPLTVTVTQGTAPPQPATPQQRNTTAPDTLNGQDFFVEAEVDNAEPYVGQQVIYTFRFYQAVNLFDQPRYDAPNFTGFWSQQQPNQTQYTTQAAGRTYRVTELHTVLFPTIAGKTTIEPAVLTIPGDIFSSGEILSTKPIDLTVKDLPAGAPADFNGAVGHFSLDAAVDSTKATVNEPVTLKVTISGDGNLENLPDPVWDDIPGWRAFESKATTDSSFADGRFSGTRTYERLLVPTVAGTTTLPPVRYSYFDPDSGEYHTLTTPPIRITVAPAADEPPVPAVTGGGKQDVTQLATDIRHIKAVPPQLATARPPVTRSTGYWLLWGLPLLALAGNGLWVRRQSQLRQNTALARRLQARKRAKKALAAARAADDPYSAIGQAVTGYLSDKFNRPVGGLTQTALAELLAGAGLDGDAIKRVQTVLTACDMGRFSPAAGQAGHTESVLADAEMLIDDLEKVL